MRGNPQRYIPFINMLIPTIKTVITITSIKNRIRHLKILFTNLSSNLDFSCSQNPDLLSSPLYFIAYRKDSISSSTISMLKTTILISLDYYNFTFFISWGVKMIIISGSCLLRQYDIILMISVSFSNTFHTHFLRCLYIIDFRFYVVFL